MSDSAPVPGAGAQAQGVQVRHLPVPVPPPPTAGPAPPIMSEVLEPAGPRTVAAAQAPWVPAPLAAAAGGLVVGLLTWALARLVRARPRRLVVGRSRRRGRSVQIAGTRSFLVDLHLIRR